LSQLQAFILIASLAIGLSSLVVAISSFLYTRKRNQVADLTDTLKAIDSSFKDVRISISAIDGRVQQVEVKISPLWAMIERMCVDRLHHPITPEIDYLLDKYKHDWIEEGEPKQMSRDEARQLIGMLQDIVKQEKDAPIDAMTAFLLNGAVRTRYNL
jgi:hypothetical protein